MPLDLTDEKTVKKLERANKAYADEDGAVLVNLMKTMAGRAFVWRKLGPILFSSAFNENPYSMAHNVGVQRQGVLLFGEISRYCPDQFALMMREAHERDTAIERSLSQDIDRGDQGPDEQQLDLYRDLSTGRIAVEWEPGADTSGNGSEAS